jgi:signal transduction histidine kinase
VVDESLDRREALNEKLMNLTSDLVNMALGLYLENGGQEKIEITRDSWERFEEFCRVVRSDPVRRERCDRDHYNRAHGVAESCLKVCHAGLVNLCVPVVNRDGIKAVFIGGEFQITDPEFQRQAQDSFDSFVQAFNIGHEEALRLQTLRERVRHYSVAEFNQEKLPTIQRVADVFAEYLNAFEEYTREAENIAHNFSTQMRSIFNQVYQLINLLHSTPNTRRDFKEAAQEVLHAVTVLSDIVNSYLATYEDSTVKFKPERIDQLIRRAANTYRAEASERNIDLRFELTPEVPVMVECSRDQLLVALRNLIHNAIKYSYTSVSSQDRRRYVLIAGRVRGEGYEIAVENYGVGIESDEYELIFQRGYQGRQTRREFRSGAGRGLPLAQHYIERIHHGSIRVQSECVGDVKDASRPQPYRTRFTVWLPLKQAEGNSS